jgi:hypothetical protein
MLTIGHGICTTHRHSSLTQPLEQGNVSPTHSIRDLSSASTCYFPNFLPSTPHQHHIQPPRNHPRLHKYTCVSRPVPIPNAPPADRFLRHITAVTSKDHQTLKNKLRNDPRENPRGNQPRDASLRHPAAWILFEIRGAMIIAPYDARLT